jgi:hypothetical protein
MARKAAGDNGGGYIERLLLQCPFAMAALSVYSDLQPQVCCMMNDWPTQESCIAAS